MSIGSLLLQPERISRARDDAESMVVRDVMRLAVLLAEDAGEQGPLAGVFPDLIERIAERVQSRAGGSVSP